MSVVDSKTDRLVERIVRALPSRAIRQQSSIQDVILASRGGDRSAHRYEQISVTVSGRALRLSWLHRGQVIVRAAHLHL